MEQFPAMNPNPVLRVGKDGTVLYSNEAGGTLLHEWGVEVGEKLPSHIGDFVERVISQNNSEKMEFKVGKRIYLVSFHPLIEEVCVNLYGFDISPQKEIEEKLQASENLYRMLFDHSMDAIILTDPRDSGKIISANPAACRMLGWNEEELIGKGRDVMFDLQDLELFTLLNERAISGAARGKLTYKRKDGTTFLGEVSTAFFTDINGEPLSVAIIRDITEHKKIEEALKKAYESMEEKVKERTTELENAYNSLKESQEGLSEAQRLAHIGNWYWDIETDRAYWSDELYRIFGRDPQELAPSYNVYLSYVHPDDREYADNSHKEALNGKPFSIDHRLVLSSGEVRTIHMKTEVIFNEKNIPIRLKGTVQDITERKSVEEKLRESEEKYRNIVETANEGILITDNENVITFVNQKLVDMLGFTLEEFISRQIWGFISEEYIPIVKMNLEKRRQGTNGNYELKLIHKDGSPLWVFLNAKPLLDKEGKYVGAMSMLTDITKRKEAEEALRNFEIPAKRKFIIESRITFR